MKDVRELMRELGRSGITVFISSHLLHEIELVCNRAAIVRKGRLIAQGPVASLRPKGTGVKVLTGNQAKAREVLARLVAPAPVREDEGHLVIDASDEMVAEMVRRLVADNVDVLAVIPAVEQGLEDMFLELTGSDEPEVAR
jgi:ABC-2 type transport system ATP-binding protein